MGRGSAIRLVNEVDCAAGLMGGIPRGMAALGLGHCGGLWVGGWEGVPGGGMDDGRARRMLLDSSISISIGRTGAGVVVVGVRSRSMPGLRESPRLVRTWGADGDDWGRVESDWDWERARVRVGMIDVASGCG